MVPARDLVCTMLLFGFTISGCMGIDEPGGPRDEVAPSEEPRAASAWPNATIHYGAVFTPSKIIDPLRAGGEPAIVATDQGTLIVAAHPGYTHLHPTKVPTEAILPSQVQSYLWRSTDKGETWTHVSLLPVDVGNTGPRGVGQGIGDPDLAIDDRGRIWMTDLLALAEVSISWSDDDGITWAGNTATGWAFADRQWLTASGSTVWVTAAGFTRAGTDANTTGGGFSLGGENLVSSNNGVNWEPRGATPCNYSDFVALPSNETLILACTPSGSGAPGGISVSNDGGATWDIRPGPLVCGMCGPAIDGGGNVWLAAGQYVTLTVDRGHTWLDPVHLGALFPELEVSRTLYANLWAGSEGRAAVTWMAAPGVPAVGSTLDAEWHVYSVLIINATTSPEFWPVKLTTEPFHRGPTCGGLGCQYGGIGSSMDRRIGDLFETTIGPDGRSYVVYGNTEAHPEHAVSHVAFHKQIAGPSLVVGDVPKGFPRQG